VVVDIFIKCQNLGIKVSVRSLKHLDVCGLYDYFGLSSEEADKDIIYCSHGLMENKVLLAAIPFSRAMDFHNCAFQCTVFYKYFKSLNVVCYLSSCYLHILHMSLSC
jgi:hypothetical protein